ncbi:MAG: phosphogluconate dehydrogenase (NAD(+)-dependent, decarboxylating) [Acidimicrobiales bacterium]
MQIGMIGLGRMGANMVRRLLKAGHECVVYDVSETAVVSLRNEGAIGETALDAFVASLQPPRKVWIMVPAAFVEATISALTPLLASGDTVIDGGNSYYRDDVDRAALLVPHGIHYVDVGTSGGVFGLERGYCMMVGGTGEAVDGLSPILDALAPGEGAAPRTPGRKGAIAPEERGWLHCGPSGAGHFVKMVHNGIEYGLMAAYAEGLNILHHGNVGAAEQTHDAETTPLRDPQYYRFPIDTTAVAELWRRGSVISSWLLDLTAAALLEDPALEGFGGRVSDSGEGRWTVQAAVDEGVPAPVLATALFNRFASRGEADFADKLLSAMRKQFGGHQEKG